MKSIWTKVLLAGLFIAGSAVLFTCAQDPARRSSHKENEFTQGDLPTYLDLLVVMDSSESMTTHRKALKDTMSSFITDLVTDDSLFRIGVTSSSANRYSNQPQTLVSQFGFSTGYPAFGLDGTFTTSASNSDFITESNNPITRFNESIDKINLLSHILVKSPGKAFFNGTTFSSTDYAQYYGTTNQSSVTLSSLPGSTYTFDRNYSFGSGTLLEADDENYFEAIEMANQKVSGIFPAHSDVDVNNIPLAIMIIKDETEDGSYQSDSQAKTLIRNLRRINTSTSNVYLFSLVKDTGGRVARITHDLNDENAGVRGQVFTLDSSGSSVASAVNQIKAVLKEPQAEFCLSSLPMDLNWAVTLDGVEQTLDQDYTYDEHTNCITFFTAPPLHSTVKIVFI